MSKIGEGIKLLKCKLRNIKCFTRYKWIVFLVLLALGLILDWMYWGIIDIPFRNEILIVIKWFLQPIGFSYTRAYSILKSSLGITITTFSLVVNMGLNISNRLEQKIFGIPKNEFAVLKPQLERTRFRKMIYWVPFFMIIFINLQWCTAGYLLLFLSLCLLVKDCKVLAESYDRSKDCEILVDEILNRVESENYKDEKVLWEQQAFLREIRIGIEKIEGWRRAGALLSTFMEKVICLDDEKCFIQSYYFFKEIFSFGTRNEENAHSVFYAKIFIDSIYGMLSVEDSKKNRVLWAVLSSSMPQWNENEVAGFLTWFLDFTGRRRRNASSQTEEDIYLIQACQSGMILLILEYWLDNYYMVENCRLERQAVRVWEYGKVLFERNERVYLENCLQCSEEFLEYDNIEIRECFQNLETDSIDNRGRSYIGRLVLS